MSNIGDEKSGQQPYLEYVEDMLKTGLKIWREGRWNLRSYNTVTIPTIQLDALCACLSLSEFTAKG